MSRKKTKTRQAASPAEPRDTQGKKAKQRPAPIPVDVHDGIPDRVADPSSKRLILVLAIFALWVAFLLYVLLGAPILEGTAG